MVKIERFKYSGNLIKAMIISDGLLKKLSIEKEALEKKPSGILNSLKDLFKTSLKDEASLHSCKLEHECADFEGHLENGKRVKSCIYNLGKAWEWGLDNFPSGFNEDFIIELAKRVKPCEIKGYRERGVTISGASTTPPYPAKLKNEMKEFIHSMNYGTGLLKKESISPVELAIVSHFHLARIHPFEDGNGRSSRLLQNLILNNYGFPTAIIYKGEKQDYIHHLDEAVKNYKLRSQDNRNHYAGIWHHISDAERNLYNYLTAKVLVSFDLVNSGKYKI